MEPHSLLLWLLPRVAADADVSRFKQQFGRLARRSLMGNEATWKVHFDKQQSQGKALLETGEILFRGEFRLKIPFSAVKSAKVVDGELRLQTADGLAVFHLGAAAKKWRDKILHPKSRIEKLGVKPGAG